MTNVPQVVPGPYVVSEQVRGESITLTRVPNWWGDGKRASGPVQLRPHRAARDPAERRLDYLRRGEIDLMAETSARSGTRTSPSPRCATAGSAARAS
jgi:ABC-type oligopeptide transport system substrate-binding subunit